MAFLVVAGVTVPVAESTTAGAPVEIGDRARAFEGTMLSTVRAHKEEWRVETAPMRRTDGNALRTALEGTPPLSCSGDLLDGAVSCHAAVTNVRYIRRSAASMPWDSGTDATGERVILSFTLMEE